jgi:tryptophan-rich sensory protein
MNTNNYDSYLTLIKPSWSPPAELFGPVWSVLYLIIALSFGYVIYLFIKKRISGQILLPFLLNLVFNFAFTPIQFGLQNLTLATVDIFLVLATLIWSLVAIRKIAPWIAYANIPYLAWVSFATVLQCTVTYLNW